jgi:hypothetical protein
MFLASASLANETVFRPLGVRAVTVDGTAGDDTIAFDTVGDRLRVTVNGNAREFPMSSAQLVWIDALGGDDTVTLTGTAAKEVTHFQPHMGSLTRDDVPLANGYGVAAVGIERVTANAGAGTAEDLSVFRDPPADDEFAAGGGTATLTSDDIDWLATAMAMERVRAISVSGGTDQATATPPVDLVLELLGDWTT